jgi:hypothetical protein
MKKLQKTAANKKKRSKKIIKLNIIYSETWEIIQEKQRKKIRARNKINKAKRKTAANKTNNKDKSKTNSKNKSKNKNKNNSKNNNQLTIEISEKAINSLFRNIDYKEDNKVETQLTAELETITFNKATITIRSGRIRRAPIRYRNN